MKFHRDVLRTGSEEIAAIAERIEASIVDLLRRELLRRGVVVGVSGGIDSAVCAALATRAVGPDRVVAVLMPEADSDPDSTARGRELADQLGLKYEVEDIAPALAALGCYRRRDAAIRRVFPDYGEGWRQKITLAEGLLDRDRVSYFNLTVAAPDGRQQTARMPTDVYLEVVAATNMKQRSRKLIEYFHAEARNYAVLGTPNRLEYELGFFVRGGDGLADLKPIAQLYKTEVYALAAFLGLPRSIQDQLPSTDTYSLPQTQEEFYFGHPYERMDLLMWGQINAIPAAELAPRVGLAGEEVTAAYGEIERRRVATEYLHAPATLID
jgi:NAD+ synthase